MDPIVCEQPGPRALCGVWAAFLCACSAVRRERRETRGESSVAARHVTPALWRVAVLNHRAIIWCQVAQTPQTSVTALPRSTIRYLRAPGSTQLLADTFPWFHSFVLLQLSHVIHQVKSYAFACIVFQAECGRRPPNVL